MNSNELNALIREMRAIARMPKGHSFKRRHGDTRHHGFRRSYRNTRCGGKGFGKE